MPHSMLGSTPDSATFPLLVASNILMLLFVPAMLLVPLVAVLCVRQRADGDPARAHARTRVLIIATAAALGVWLLLQLLSVYFASPGFALAARWCWPLFFPLWFALGMPALRAKYPGLAGLHSGAAHSVRRASVVSRQRKSPIRAIHWVIVGVVVAALLATIAARGWAKPFSDDAAQFRWLVVTLGYAFVLATVFAIQPYVLRMALAEPEPLDAEGSPELQRMYEAFRNTKIRGLFWLLSGAIPVLLGAVLVLTTWGDHRFMGALIGGFGGAGLGICGAWFGVAMTVRRIRIAEVKARLDAQGTQPG